MQQIKITVAAVMAATLAFSSTPLWAQHTEGGEFPKPGAEPAALLVQGLPDFSNLVEHASSTVVNIRTMRKVGGNGLNRPYMAPDMQDFFDFFFNAPMPRDMEPWRYQQKPQQDDDYIMRPSGVGSGFIITADGFIMTNAHVVDGADELVVTLQDEKEYSAKVVGADKRTDVALLKIEGVNNLPTVSIGDPNKLKVGEWVVAIGSPFGLENTVTAGIVSAKQRDTGEYVSFIQSDVAVNPGNSGGPLINMRGEVVGINSQIYSRSGGFMGISFSIPIDEAMQVAQQLREHGHVERGRIGVLISPTSNEVAQALGLGDKAYGAMVNAVAEDGPAAKAGIEPGDIIAEVNGVRMERFSDVSRVISNIKPGDKAKLKVFRQGAWKTIEMAVEAIPGEGESATLAGDVTPDVPYQVNALGLSVVDLSDAQKKEAQVDHGVMVSSINRASARAVLSEGDIILQIGNVRIDNTKQFNDAVAKLPENKEVVLLAKQREGVQYVMIKPRR